jgi:hypothetical protein
MKTTPIERLKAMTGKVYMYRASQISITKVEQRQDEILIKTLDRDIKIAFNHITDFIAECLPMDADYNSASGIVKAEAHPALSVITSQASTMQDLGEILKSSIERVQKDPGYIPQAKEIGSNVKTMLQLAKLQLEMVKELRK